MTRKSKTGLRFVRVAGVGACFVLIRLDWLSTCVLFTPSPWLSYFNILLLTFVCLFSLKNRLQRLYNRFVFVFFIPDDLSAEHWYYSATNIIIAIAGFSCGCIQNSTKESKWARAARQGTQVTWFIGQGKWGLVVDG